jgi:hypothetical protein
MFKGIVRSLTFYAFSALNFIYAYRALKREFVKLVETEKAENKFHYVAIRLARGDYNSMDSNAFKQMRFDFKFNDIASQYHAKAHFKD